jgi:DNA-binding CsgD family transcriptional regulator
MADALALPMLLVRRDGTLLHANAAGRAAVQQPQSPLRLAEGRLRPRATADVATFAAALRDLPAGRRGGWHAGSDASRPVAMAALRQPPGVAGTAVLVTLAMPAHGVQAVDDVARAHGLTPAQTRVLRELAAGRAAREAATALGLTLATVRSHIAAIRSRTGARSLNAVLAEVSRWPPLAPPR